jgi:hypothetical protein
MPNRLDDLDGPTTSWFSRHVINRVRRGTCPLATHVLTIQL